MGVQGLWELLAPVGRRVSVETLAGKKLAIDASIWMIQFMKAMRDERGEMVRNAHLLGFFRRICKLLFLRTKPVFVFDGGTPALKRRTVAARQRHRDNARAKIRKTAEKLLLNHLKSKRLEELAEEIKRCKSGAKGESKGKQVASLSDNPELSNDGILGESHRTVDRTIAHESLDQMLAASIAAEEEGKLMENDLMPSDDIRYEEEGGEDEDEEMIYLANSGNIDPAVLASLPPSMQLDLLDQMRERLMAENRQKYQKFKKLPTKFSELQIQSYLKTVAFRREINEVQKCAAGRGVGGLQTSRIASEANREYIFSSSFTGDKQMLASTGAENGGSEVIQDMRKITASDTVKGKVFMSPSKLSTDLITNRNNTEFTPDVETYLDDRGRVRVSRVRGLGIHMTRDLQRNLDLMKEYEQLVGGKNTSKSPKVVLHSDASDVPKDYSETNCRPSRSLLNEENNDFTNASIADDVTPININSPKSTTGSVGKAAIEVCFTEEEVRATSMVDNFFFNLVSGDSTSELFSGSMCLEKNGDHSESECIWEDGMVGEQNIDVDVDCEKPVFLQSKVCEDDEVEWEEGDALAPHTVENVKTVSLGLLEEEANLQEAIRRSLEDIKIKHSSSVIHVEASTMAVKVQSSQIPLKTSVDRELPVEKRQLHSDAECSSGSDDLLLIASKKPHLPTTSVPQGRLDGNSILTDKTISAVSKSDVGLLDEVQPTEQSKNEYVENHFKLGSKLIADAPKSRKLTDEVENDPIIDLETTGSRMDASPGYSHKDSADFPSTVSLETGPNISFSSEAKSCIDVSLNLTEETEARIATMQGLTDNDNSKNVSEGLAFSGQTLMEDEDGLAAAQANFDDEIAILEQERTSLGEEKRKLERNAESVSSEMFVDCQELLQMFGLPYIIAPMEAEAQCAYMEMLHFVDGVVTDDSDVFLFGARNVYKNIFDDRKYVETYFMKDIESELGLNRDKLIHMALLLGSDYTEGVSGIGIVNAIEVVNAFPEEDGLVKFRDWVESPDPSILGLHGSSKASTKSLDGIESNLSGTCSQSPDVTVSDPKRVFMDKHRNVSKNWHFPPSFPSVSVNSAYNSPQIDKLTKSFAWGMPDLPLLRELCWEKFGWPNQKADELLVPVLKEYNKHETQLRLEAFYSFNESFAKVRSQRIRKAIKGITGKCSSELTDIDNEGSSSRRKRGNSALPDEQSRADKVTDLSTSGDKKSSKRTKREAKRQTPPHHGSAESSKQDEGSAKNRARVNARVKSQAIGRGRGRGRGRGQCKGKVKEELNAENPESSPVDESGSPSEILKSTSVGLRRSTRHRNQVSYVENGAQGDEENEVGCNGHQDDNILEDSLQSGGGSCLEEPSSYLVSGGGFCMEEGDSDLVNAQNSILERCNQGDSFEGYEERSHEETRVLEKLGLEEKNGGDGETQFSLTPMPSLKRRRTKG